MKALLAKEFRLVQPSFWSALVLVLVGNLGLSAANWLVSNANYSSPLLPSWYPRQPLYWFWFAAVMLALVPFGREFSLNTFGLLLAQPLERKRIWWSKVAVASGALAALFAVWAITSSPLVDPWIARSDWGHLVGFGALGGLVALVGGLWTSLLLRQLGAAFWLTLLIPVAIVIVTGGSSEWVPVMVLCAYSVAGFLWAWRYFLGGAGRRLERRCYCFAGPPNAGCGLTSRTTPVPASGGVASERDTTASVRICRHGGIIPVALRCGVAAACHATGALWCAACRLAGVRRVVAAGATAGR